MDLRSPIGKSPKSLSGFSSNILFLFNYDIGLVAIKDNSKDRSLVALKSSSISLEVLDRPKRS